MCWLAIAVILSNHDLFMHPVQPLHFDRGYVWSALFLIAAPSLVSLVDFLMQPYLLRRIGLGVNPCGLLRTLPIPPSRYGSSIQSGITLLPHVRNGLILMKRKRETDVETEVVVDLGARPDGGTGAADIGLLLDGDRWDQVGDDNQAIAGKIERNILQIVNPRAAFGNDILQRGNPVCMGRTGDSTRETHRLVARN